MSQGAKPSGGGGGGGGGGGAAPQDSGMGPFWVLCLLAITGWFIWYYMRAYIVAGYFTIKLWEARFLSLFTEKLDNVILYIETTAPGEVPFQMLISASAHIGEYLRYPIIAILGMLAFVLYFSNATSRFRKTHNMASLREQEQHNWPQIKVVIKLDLVSEDVNKGAWATAMNPLEFCEKHHLLKKNEISNLEEDPYAHVTASIKRGDTARVFAMQLGSLWQGPDKLRPYALALFAVFAARINNDRTAADKLLLQISTSGASEELDFTGARELAYKYANTPKVQRIMGSHAYTLTVMASLIMKARDDGVLASADFLWLKPVDRRLWYMLNNVGRQTAFIEVAGTYAHWLMERALGRPLLTPMVKEAIDALASGIKDYKLAPEKVAELED